MATCVLWGIGLRKKTTFGQLSTSFSAIFSRRVVSDVGIPIYCSTLFQKISHDYLLAVPRNCSNKVYSQFLKMKFLMPWKWSVSIPSIATLFLSSRNILKCHPCQKHGFRSLHFFQTEYKSIVERFWKKFRHLEMHFTEIFLISKSI